MEKIILFYKFFEVAEPDVWRLWQLELASRLNLTGRLIIAPTGFNGTLAGRLNDLKAYKKALKEQPQLRDLEIKWSAGERKDFPKLSVKVRKELVSLKPKKAFDPNNSSPGLSPKQWHQYLLDHPEVTVLDARNYYESEIGNFNVKNLIKPAIKTFDEVKEVTASLDKQAPLLTYCTGDVRCEYLSAYLRSEGFQEVHHLRGGIIKYGQQFADTGFWRGACYVFDRRGQINFSTKSETISSCHFCQKETSQQANCDDCNRQIVVCLVCQEKSLSHCQQKLSPIRTN